MAYPQNVERKHHIECEARRLFRDKGYKKTSYADIADACGLEKTNIQIHFPKKELFVNNFLQDLLDAADEYFLESGLKTDNYIVNFYLVGQIYHAFLLSEPGLRTFLSDILSDRSLTEAIIQADLDWANSYIVSSPDFKGGKAEVAKMMEDITFIMGGIYELLYRDLKNGIEADPTEIQYKTMSTFMLFQGVPEEAVKELLLGEKVSKIDFGESTAFLAEKLFG